MTVGFGVWLLVFGDWFWVAGCRALVLVVGCCGWRRRRRRFFHPLTASQLARLRSIFSSLMLVFKLTANELWPLFLFAANSLCAAEMPWYVLRSNARLLSRLGRAGVSAAVASIGFLRHGRQEAPALAHPGVDLCSSRRQFALASY